MQKQHRPVRVYKLPRVLQRRIEQALEIFKISGLPIDKIPCLHQCNVYLKGSYGCGEHKNEIYQSVQNQHRPVRVNKLPRVLHRSIGQAIEIFKISGLPINMAPCLHQCNVYIKRKLLAWRAQKCNLLVSAKTAPTGTGQQSTPCFAAPY